MVEDKKWCAFGKFGMVHPVMLDLTNGGWVSIQKVEGQGTMHRHAAAVTVRTLDGAGATENKTGWRVPAALPTGRLATSTPFTAIRKLAR